MRRMLRPSFIAGCVVLLALPLYAQQQDSSSQQQQNPPAQKDQKQQKEQPKKGAAQENPFPEAQSQAAAQQGEKQGSGAAPDAPQPQDATQNAPGKAAQPGSQAKPSSADQNPFPEEQSEKAARQAQQPESSAPNSSSGSADDSSYSSSHVKGLDMPTTDETVPANLPASPLPYDPKLARKDANIGDFYMESGNWKGAYERFLEANRSDPGNAEAVFGLGESARHLHHEDEALRNYRLYLSALPRGPHAKEIHKALKEMGAEP